LLIFLQQKFANSEAIVRQTWERYRTNNGGSITSAIDWAIKQYNANSSLADEFPKFTWNNYFLNHGTYDRRLNNIYPNVENPGGGPVSMDEWELFRSKLFGDRRNNGNAGVFVPLGHHFQQPGGLSIDWPTINQPYPVDYLGAVYLEYYPDLLPTGRLADLTLTVTLRRLPGGADPTVSVISFADFTTTPHPGNNLISPNVTLDGDHVVYQYTQTIQNFHQLKPNGRVAMIISNPGGWGQFSCRAEVILR
jgi:hypothetical protein